MGWRRIGGLCHVLVMGALIALVAMHPRLANSEPASPANSVSSARKDTPEQARAVQADQSKIAGGEKADPEKYPWIVAIGEMGPNKKVFPYCAGTLISKGWVLTAAHCRVVEGDFAVVSRPDLSEATAGKEVQIKVAIVHPDFCPKSLDHDVALLELETPQDARSISVTDASESAVPWADRISIAGWGKLGEQNNDTPNNLQQATVVIYSQDACISNYASINRLVTDFMFCAQGKAITGVGLSDACKGDSGGPIVAFDDGRKASVLIGVISKGEGCARAKFPGVYTKISKLQNWIEKCQESPTPQWCRRPSRPAC